MVWASLSPISPTPLGELRAGDNSDLGSTTSVDSRANLRAAALRLVSGDLLEIEVDKFSAGAELATLHALFDIFKFAGTLVLLDLLLDTSVGEIWVLGLGPITRLGPRCFQKSLSFLPGYRLVYVVPLSRGPNLAHITRIIL